MIKDRLLDLRSRLSTLAPGLVAVSGGLDSRVLAALAWRWGLDFTPIHLRGPHIPPAESDAALAWIEAQGKQAVVLDVDPLTIPEVAGNDKLRCYHCKKAMFAAILGKARELGLATVIEGTQASDTNSYRPGRKALEELGIISPLAEAGLTKPELRQIAREYDIAGPDQPARPCLLTRFEYGLTTEADLLHRLAAAEAELADLGLSDFRIRVHADGRIVLQVLEGQQVNETAVLSVLASYDFSSCSLLGTPTVSGYFDR